MADISRKTKRYPTDLTDEEGERIKPLMPKLATRGRTPSVDLREMLNAICYMARSGSGWRMLITDFWAVADCVLVVSPVRSADVVPDDPRRAVMLDHERAGREASPAAGVVDSQSIKAPHGAARGYDAATKTVGRRRHIVVDTDGRLLMVNLTTADISDSAGAQPTVEGVRKR